VSPAALRPEAQGPRLSHGFRNRPAEHISLMGARGRLRSKREEPVVLLRSALTGTNTELPHVCALQNPR
jgi:hypothetical protein